MMEQQGYNDGAQGKGMALDPKWTDAEKQKYIAAYTSGKNKQK